MAGWLEGKVALVTGGGSGIGRAVAERFVQKGAGVCVLDRSAEGLATMAAEKNQSMALVQGDVRSSEDNQKAVDAAVSKFGQLDVFVGNAAIFDCFLRLMDLPSMVIDTTFDEIFGVNVKGYLLGAKAALSELVKRHGSMIFTLSNAGLYAGGGGPLYTSSKHAALGMIRQLAYELAPHVRVNGVAPGGTMTALSPALSLRQWCADRSESEKEDRIRQSTPLHIVMYPRDHAAAYVLLASDQARAMTGVVIPSDGGLGARGLWHTPPLRNP